MRRGTIKIGADVRQRLEVYLGNNITKSKRFTINFGLLIIEYLSYIYPPYRFDSIWDFLINQGELSPGSEVSFCTYAQVVDKREYKPDNLLELDIADSSGRARLHYTYDPEFVELMKERKYYPDPLYGSLEGDRIWVLLATYLGKSTIHTKNPFSVLNEDHYRRFLNGRELPLVETAKR